MKNSLFAAVAVLLLTSGCISMEYTGEKLPPRQGDAKIAVFSDSAKIGKAYTVLGTAVVSGNYQDVSRDRMIKKLREEAKNCGADAILLVEQQVVPGTSASSANPVFMTAFDYDDSDQNWSQLYRDVDRNFVNTRRNKSNTTAGSSNNFKRIIRAEFIRYNSGK